MSRGELDVDVVVETTLRKLSSYFEYVSREDLRQEAYLYLADHPEEVERYRTQYTPGVAARYLGAHVGRALRKVGEREKAYYQGYELEDQHEYSARAIQLRGLIAQCLTAIVTDVRQPEQRPSEGPSNADPAETSMNFIVSMLDIEKGWEKLRPSDQKMLAEYFVYGKTSEEMAAEYGCTRVTLYKMLKKALRRLVGPLNGVQF